MASEGSLLTLDASEKFIYRKISYPRPSMPHGNTALMIRQSATRPFLDIVHGQNFRYSYLEEKSARAARRLVG
jgi:hypothetical protein